jgi:hypothetical protein
VPIQLKEAIKA